MSTPSPLSSQNVREATIIEAGASPHVLQLIPSVHRHQGRDEEQVQLATVMRSLVLDQQHPIALEVSGTDQQRCLLIRARTSNDLKHVETQLQARLPQATFVPLMGHDDPFHLRPDETVSVVELQPGQAAYLPLQEFARMKQGEDPILGILGAVDALPADLRAIAQLALVPAPPTWSQAYQRKALEHALEPERQHDRQIQAMARDNAGAPSTLFLVLGALILAVYFLFQYAPHLLPAWVPPACEALLAGKWQQVWSGPHQVEIKGLIAGLVLLLALPLVLRRFWSRLRQQPLYDMRSVAEKTSRPAYQVRLRLYVIGPHANKSSRTSIWHHVMITLVSARAVGWSGLRQCVSHLQAHQWAQAAKTAGLLIVMVGKGSWYGGATLIRACKQSIVRQWQLWQEAKYQQARRSQILARLTAAYRQYHLASGNYFVPRRVSVRHARSWVRKGTWWKQVERSRHLIDVETLGALWHVPADGALPHLAHLAYHRSQTRLLPPSLHSAQQEPRIGFSEHAGHRVPFGLPADCLQSHMLIGGKSGEGKSTMEKHLALRNMREHNGLIVIDPHGDQIDQLLALVPPDRLDDVVLIDLSDERFACGLNPIDATVARGRDKAISDLIKVLSNIWGSAWGSRMEIAFEYSLRTLYEVNKALCKQGKETQQYTLLDVMPILTNESFCHALLEQIDDLFIRRWWASYYDPLSLQMQRDRVDPVLSKVAKFESTIARWIVGQSLCSVDFTACIAQKKIVFVKLAKGLIGEDVARILGATVLGFLNIALEEQAKIEEALRNQVLILIDEFQTLDGVDWNVLAELRKFGATFCLATQSLEYLREKKMLSVVLANVKQLAIFRMSTDDARMVCGELDVDPEDILHLESLMCYLKLVYQKQQHPTFSLKLDFPPPGDKNQAEQIRARCQRNFMRPVGDIETEIAERITRESAATPSKDGEKKQNEIKREQKEGHARQDGGNRGRRGQEKRAGESDAIGSSSQGEITSMNWNETVGSSSDDPDKEEQEEDPGDCAQ